MRIRFEIKYPLLWAIVITIVVCVTSIIGIAEIPAKAATLLSEDASSNDEKIVADMSTYIAMHQTSGVPTLFSIATETATCTGVTEAPAHRANGHGDDATPKS